MHVYVCTVHICAMSAYVYVFLLQGRAALADCKEPGLKYKSNLSCIDCMLNPGLDGNTSIIQAKA